MDAAQGRRMPHEWRILEQGPEGLTDIDLLSSLLARSSRRFGPEEIAARVLSTGLSALRRASAGELLSIEGVRERDAARVLAALELGRRVAQATAPRRERLLQATDMAALLAPYDAMIKGLTPAQVQAAANKFFNTKNYTRIVLMPISPLASF